MRTRLHKAGLIALSFFTHLGIAKAETIVFDGFGNGAVQVFETAETGVQFYGRRNFPTFPVNANGLNFYFHRDTNTGILSLGLIVDDRGDGTGGRLRGDITGLGAAASVAFSDDSGELQLASPGVAVFNYRWVSCCTDGGIISGLDASNLNFTINLTQVAGLTGTYLIGPNGTTQIAGAPVLGGFLTVSANPEPAAWALFILGFGACAIAMKRRRQRIILMRRENNAAAPAHV